MGDLDAATVEPARMIAVGRAAVFPALALLTAYLIFIGGGWAGIYWVQLRILSLALGSALLVTWGVVAWRDASWRPRSRLTAVLVVGLGAMLVSTAFSRQPRLGFDYLAYAVLLVAFYVFLVRVLAHPFFRGRFMDLVAMLAAVLGIAYVVQVVGTWIEWWGLIGGFAPPPLRPAFAGLGYGNPNAVMAVSILLTAPAVAHVGFGSRRRAAISSVLVGLALFCTIASGSRAGWLGLGLATVATLAVWLIEPGHRAQVMRALRSGPRRWTTLAAVVTAVLLGTFVAPGIIARIVGGGGESVRLGFFQASVRIFAESPFLGTGPGTWAAERATHTTAALDDYYVPHAHDVYLQTAAELGVLGLIAGAFALLLIARLVLRAIRSRDRARAVMGWAAAFAVAYASAHQLLEFFPGSPAILAALAVPIAWLDAHDGDEPLVERGQAAARERWVGVVGPAALVVSLAWLGFSEGVALVHREAVAAIDGADSETALAMARRAASADPDIPAYQFTLGLAAMNAGDPQEALSAYAKAAEVDDFPESWLGLAMAQIETGDQAGARVSLERGLRLGRRYPTVAIAAGQLYARLGDDGAAQAAYLDAVAVAPSLFGDPGLSGLIRPTAIDDLARAAIARLGSTAGAVDVALELGDRDRATALATTFVSGDRDLLDVVIPAWFGDPEAVDALADLARRRPQDLVVQDWAGRVAARSLDPAATGTYRRIADISLYPFSGIGSETRLVPPGDPRAGGDITIYGAFLYRRPTPYNMLPASLVGLRNA